MMQLTEACRLALTTVVATVVLGAATVAGSGQSMQQYGKPGRPGSGSATSVADVAARVPTVPADRARVRGVKGTPPLAGSALAELDIPVAALLAYQGAAAVMKEVDERCGLSWTLLAAIGRVESDHGRYGGGELMADGTSSVVIRGVALDGTGPVAKIRDTDAGILDGDQVWDRAVGPMQFLPSTWSVVAVDADGDGVRSPDDLQDAALAAAVLLCSSPGALDTSAGRRTAVFRYNPSRAYVASVLALERAYRAGDFDVPGPSVAAYPAPTVQALGPVPATPGKDGARGGPGGGNDSASPDGHQPDPTPDPSDGPGEPPTATPEPDWPAEPGPTDPPTPTDDPTGTPGPTGPPEPGPSDGPSPEPPGPSEPPDDPAPDPVRLTGVLTACGPALEAWCLGEVLLDVGDAAFLEAPAGVDLDADGAVETRAAELTGLADTEVSVLAVADTAPAFVVAVNDLAYDGR